MWEVNLADVDGEIPKMEKKCNAMPCVDTSIRHLMDLRLSVSSGTRDPASHDNHNKLRINPNATRVRAQSADAHKP